MSPLIENVPTMALQGYLRVCREDTGEVVFEQKNVIVNVVKSLFARLMANSSEPLFGVWGLAIGAGSPSWSDNAQPDAQVTQQALFSEILRKKCSFVRFVDVDLNPLPQGEFSEIVDFQTVLNATLDNITVPIREMGLIGGGTHGTPDTNMGNAPYWDPATGDPNSVSLINYKTMPPLALPPGINFIVSWILRF